MGILIVRYPVIGEAPRQGGPSEPTGVRPPSRWGGRLAEREDSRQTLRISSLVIVT